MTKYLGSLNFILYSVSVTIVLYALYAVAVDMSQRLFSLYDFMVVTGLLLCTAYLILIYLGMLNDIGSGRYDWE